MLDALRQLSTALRHLLVALAIGLLVFSCVFLARHVGGLASWELGAFDRFLLRSEPAATEPVVAMVWITEHEIQQYGHPLEDHLLARVLEGVLAHGPRAIGLDIYRDRPTGKGWEELQRIFLSNPQIVIVEKRPDTQLAAVGPPDFLLPSRAQVGFADIVIDSDGVVRRGLLYLWEGQNSFVSLSLQLALRFLYPEGITLGAAPDDPQSVALGSTVLPPLGPDFGGYRGGDAGGYQFMYDYRQPKGLPSATFNEVIEGKVDPELLRDKVVIIGTASPSVKDFFQSPVGRVNGAELHAQAIDQLVRYGRARDHPISVWSEAGETAWIFAWCLAGALFGIRVRSTLGLLVATMGGVAALVGGAFWVFLSSWWIPVVPSTLGWISSVGLAVAYVIQEERSERRKMRGIFDKFMSPKLAKSLWENKEIFWHGDRPRPQRAVASILLSDLFGYTTRTEKAEPSDVMEWLGLYTDRMTELVDRHGGMVHDFLGDGLMASFGLPFAREDEKEIDADAVSTVECALEMGEALEELNEAWDRAGQPTARLRVGILTGPVVVGAIGGTDRMKYAAIGDTVNTAARLEAFDKEGFEADKDRTCRVLVGQATLDRLGNLFESRCLGDHVLKGKGRAVTIHQILGRSRDLPPGVLGGSR